MGRRSDHSREELAALVVGAAQRITAAEGWRAATARRIGAEIGYAPGSIYNAVGDIDEVLLHVGANVLTTLGERLVQAREKFASGEAVPTVLAITDAYLDFVSDNARLWSVLVERPPPKNAPQWYAEPRAQLLTLVEDALAPFFADEKSRRKAALALWSSLQGVAALSAGGNLAFALGGHDKREIAHAIVLRYLTGSEEIPASSVRR
jgi:AcrR family transcriptional regulator